MTIIKTAIAAAMIAASVLPATAKDIDSQTDFVMLTLGWTNNEGAYIVSKGYLPEFANASLCNASAIPSFFRGPKCNWRLAF